MWFHKAEVGRDMPVTPTLNPKIDSPIYPDDLEPLSLADRTYAPFCRVVLIGCATHGQNTCIGV
jgi:hypothetical protein